MIEKLRERINRSQSLLPQIDLLYCINSEQRKTIEPREPFFINRESIVCSPELEKKLGVCLILGNIEVAVRLQLLKFVKPTPVGKLVERFVT